MSEVLGYGTTQLIPRGITLITSWLIINYHSSGFWGSYVEILLPVNIALLLMGYGNFQYLLKAFSESPASTMTIWSKCIFSRLLILIPIGLALAIIPINITLKLLILSWIVVTFINQSFHILIVFNKKFTTSLLVELFSGIILVSTLIYFNESLTLTSFIGVLVFSMIAKMLLYTMSFWKVLSKIHLSVDISYFKDGLPFAFLNLIGTLRVQADTYIVALFLDNSNLGKYHILVTIFMLIESGAAYIFNPSAKLFYRISNQTLNVIKRNALVIGLLFAILTVAASFFILNLYSTLSFPNWFYLIILTFAMPQLYKILILNELIKLNAQNSIALLAFIFFLIQGAVGLAFIPSGGIQAAIILRAAAFIIHLLALHFYSQRYQLKLSN